MQVLPVNPLRKSKESGMKIRKELQTISHKLKKHKSQDTYLKQGNVKEINKKYLLTEKSNNHSKEVFPQTKISPHISSRVVSPGKQIKMKSNQISPRVNENINKDKENQSNVPIKNQTQTHLKFGSLDKIMSDNESCQEIESDEIDDKQYSDESIIDETEISEMNSEFYPSTNMNQICSTAGNKINQKSLAINNTVKYHINKFPTLSSNPFMETNDNTVCFHNNTAHKIETININLNTDTSHQSENVSSNKDYITLSNKINNITITTNPNSNQNSSSKTPPTITVNLNQTSLQTNHDNNIYASNNNNNKTSSSPKENELDMLLRSMLIVSKKGDKETLLELLEQILHYPKADLNFKDENGFTALHYACDEGNFKIVDILIKANCDVNTKTITNKKTPLHLTAKHGFFDISKLLIENGAVINIGDNEKNTPLHLCAQGGHVELMKYFLDKLPQADNKNIYGKTPKDIASKIEIKELLKEYLGKKDNVYRNIKIHTASESTLNYMMKKFNNGNNKNKVMFQNTQNHININIQTNYNNNTSTDNNNTSNNNNNNNNSNHGNNSVDHSQNIPLTINKSNIRKSTLPSSSTKLKSIKKNAPLPSVSSSTSVSKKNIPHPKHLNINQISTSTTGNNNSNTNKTVMSKKNSISNFSMNSQLTNRKITPSVQKQNLHKTRTLQKFAMHSNINTSTSKKDSSKTTNQQLQTNTSTSLNQKINIHNISIDANDPLYRLNKTEELSKPYKTNPNDTTNPDDSNNNNNNTNNNNNLYNQISLGSIEEERITLTSFICLAMLGRGSFGEVYLVQKTNSQMLYAMKVLSKDRIMGQNLMKYAMAERNVLSLTNHPFIVKLNFAFQTNHKLFLILDYCPGGDLSKHLQYEKRFTEERARFYLCEIILALEDLHRRDIIFRDLKPDNVVLDEEGHAKLTDFGLSKEGVFDSQSAKSFCGSIAYLAPEMLKKQGHGKAVDWYLLGVLFYEMLAGIPPFFTEQKEEIFRNIEHGELIIPKKVSKDAACLLRCLLQKDPNKRLGSGPKDAQEIKEHKYFKKINWDDVYNKKITPPKTRNYSKHLKMYNYPRMFQADDQDYNNTDTVLPGWSFINNDDI